MALEVMYNRLGSYRFDIWMERCQKASDKYLDEFLEKERYCVSEPGRFTIKAHQEWKHRFFGVTKEGIPIWVRKRCQYKYRGAEVSASVSPIHQSEIYQNDKECISEEVSSFVNWKKGNKKLAFIYLNVFWTLEEGETLNDAAKRFIYSHQEVKRAFRKSRKSGENLGVSEDEAYIYALYKDGALVFQDGKALLAEYHYFRNTFSGLWAIMAAEGFFARENVEQVRVDYNFFMWYKSKVL